MTPLAAVLGASRRPGAHPHRLRDLDGEVVARLDAASRVVQGQEAELWVDARKLHLFDPGDGRSLTSSYGSDAAHLLAPA